MSSSNGISENDIFKHSDQTGQYADGRIPGLLAHFDHDFSNDGPVIHEMNCYPNSRRPSMDLNVVHQESQGSDESFRRLMKLMDTSLYARNSTRDTACRNYPSGGAIYGVQCFLINFRAMGSLPAYSVTHVRPYDQTVRLVASSGKEKVNKVLGKFGASMRSRVDGVIVFAVLPYVAIAKYGTRGYKFALIEIGSMIQEITRNANLLNIETRPWADIDEVGFAAALGMNPKMIHVELAIQFRMDNE